MKRQSEGQISKTMNLREYQQKAVEWARGSDGLIIAPAGSGKTWIAASIIKHYATLNPAWTFGWTAPTRETCQQARVSLRVAGVPESVVDVRCPHESVDFSKKQLLVIDECKHSPARVLRGIIESCNGLRYGFDATPWCDDEERNAVTRTLFFNRTYEIKRSDIGDSLADAYLEISDATDLNIQQKIDDNIDRLFNARRRYMRISDDELKRMCAWESLVDIGICQNRERNRYAMNYALEHLDMQTLILIPRITLGEEYESWIPNSRLVHSKIGKKDRRAYMEEFKAGNLRTMIATSLADEGLDLPNVELLIMVSGGRSSQKTIQRASRALRKTETKNCATIVDFSDKFHPIGAFHAKKRMKCYRELGCVFIQ
jgi:superfamily II DNA or RNA helicase